MTNTPTCKTCRHWGAGDGTASRILDDPPIKRAFAPCRIRSVHEWPQRDDNEHCGEHEPIKAVAKPTITVMGTGSMAAASPLFPYQDNCATLEQIVERRTAREAHEYGQSLDEDTARDATIHATGRRGWCKDSPGDRCLNTSGCKQGCERVRQAWERYDDKHRERGATPAALTPDEAQQAHKLGIGTPSVEQTPERIAAAVASFDEDGEKLRAMWGPAAWADSYAALKAAPLAQQNQKITKA